MNAFNAANFTLATPPKMKVEVWSDIMCPFCYIGKRNYESALEKFAERSNIEIVWRSFQLDPTIPASNGIKRSVYEYLAERKGMTIEQSMAMHQQVIQTAKNAGLSFNMDKAVVANSFEAHKMIQLAKQKGLGDQAEERLFSAYFIEGKDFGDTAILLEIGQEIGLKKEAILEALNSDDYAYLVTQDIQEAQSLGVRGVPYFIFNRRYAISGAQPPQAFLQTLEQSFAEWKNEN